MRAERPQWLKPVVDSFEGVAVTDLTAWAPPPDSNPRQSAVLMLFAEDEGGPYVLLTERSHTMRSHPGQVSFPGGKLDKNETPVEAALREAYEEIGLEPSGVDVLGALPTLWVPPSNFSVTPVIGWLAEPTSVLVKSADEVHAIHKATIKDLCDPEWRIRVHSPRAPGFVMPGFLIGEDHDVILWGFTGGVIYRYFAYMGWLNDVDEAPFVELPDYMLNGEGR
ncbi:coenzyme A pyrophosphatase [Nocardioides baekrokdamisoli]|uniref:Coenzyme A pyrophosphatase n=1 Tax=Nocardioides baekrokdamisoli TaxID=1804624 RepID=A0A3G9IF88_9ACTN|nr:CoA pyrophosphatase [Nocardioides baekrokdamisoli]BBH17690.1 coenzyme A pyrophosphatase [Nocardioides baekrokdamisoli]